MMHSSLPARLCAVLLFAGAVVCSGCLADNKSQQINELMQHCYQHDLFNGTILVAQKGDILYQGAFGYSDWDCREPLKLTSQFYLASVSKVFTGMAIMMLVERQLVSYDDTLSNFFSGFPAYADQITIRHLVNHTSGIPNWTANSEFRKAPGNFKDDLTNKDILQFLIKQESPDFEPGERHRYSNSGYVLLAMIIEEVSGLSYREFLHRYVFQPLGMEHTVVYDETRPVLRDRVCGYDMFGEKDDYNILTTGAGGIYTTVEDLYKWDQALYTEKLVPQETFHNAFVRPRLNDASTYANRWGWSGGGGWEFRKDSAEYVVRQSGGFNGFSTLLYRELYDQTAIIILTNMGQNTWQRGATMVALLNILDGQPFELPKVPIGLTMKRLIDNRGLGPAIAQYNELARDSAHMYDLSEGQLNELAYFYLNRKDFDTAIALFQLNADMFPDSPNVYDSYGEAHMLKGDYAEATRLYRRSLELAPDNTNAIKMLKQIEGSSD